VADQNQIKKLLDDPNVTGDTKKQLVRALAGAGGSEEDVRRYAQQNGVDVPSDPGFGSYYGAGVLAPVTGGASIAWLAGKEAEASKFKLSGGEADKLVKKAGEERELGSTQKVLNENGDFSTSDELLDAGAPGLRFFEKFIPLYSQAAPLCGHHGRAPDLKGEIYKNYDEVRGIDLRMFREDAHKINDATGKLDTHQNELGRSFSSLASWEGDAANAGNAYNGKFLGAAGGFIQDVKGAPGTITAGATAIQKHVKEFAQHVHDLYSEQCGGMSAEQVQDNIRKAQGNINAGDFSLGDYFTGIPDMLKGGLKGIILGGPIGGIVGEFMGLADHAKKVREHLIDEAKQKLGMFCQAFDGKKQQFDGLCRNVQTGIKSDYDTMFQALETSIKDKPFGQIGDPAPFTGDQGKGADKGRTGSSGNGTGTGTGTGGGTGGGTGSGTPPTPTPPEMKPPENPLDSNHDGKPDVPGDLDGDGKPDNVKGEHEPETVTLHHGDNEIKVAEPDDKAHVKITVDTPTGEPKTFDVDFGKNPEAANALLGHHGGAAVPGQPGGVLGQSGAPTTPGMPATPGAPSTPGAPVAPGGQGAATPVEVGPDGKAHFQADGLAFTAEVDPKTGEINLTVDNGNGSTPEKYGVDFGDETGEAGANDGGPGLPKDSLAADGGQAHTLPTHDIGTTMPAGAEPAFSTMPAEAAPAQTEPAFGAAPAEGGPQQTGPAYTTMPAEAPQAPVHGQAAVDGGHGEALAHPAVPDTSGSTVTSGASMFGGGSGGFNGTDSVLGGSPSPSSGFNTADSAWSNASSGDHGHALADTNASQTGDAGSATLPSMQDGQGQGQPATGAPVGGMMGGGMAGGGHGGSGGGDQERGPSQWRQTGSLFDDDASLSRVQGVLGDDRGGR
jgi:hypothetical protein